MKRNAIRGISLIPFVSFLLLWLVFFALWYVSYSNGEEAKKKYRSASKKLESTQRKISQREEHLRRISNLVGYHAPLEQDGILQSSFYAIREKLDTVCSEENLPGSGTDLGIEVAPQKIDDQKIYESSYVEGLTTLEDLWQKYLQRIDALQQNVSNKQKELDSLKKEYANIVAKTKEEITSLHSDIRSQLSSTEKLRQDKEQALKEAEEERFSAQEEKMKEKDALAQANRSRRDQSQKYENQVQGLEGRIFELRKETGAQKTISAPVAADKKRSLEQQNPDGEIIYVSQRLNVAYIDLGRSEGILPGLKFDVFRYAKGGERVVKGKIEVKSIKERMSKTGIIELKDNLDPIAPGDKIINPIYDRNKTKYFIIAGQLNQKYSTTEARSKLEKLGGKIEKTISARTDFVVLADGFANDPIYQRSVDLGIETMLESEFVSYLDF